MTREDTDRLFDLLALYRPGDKHLENKPLRAAWHLVLEPYQVADVRQAVAAFFRKFKFWPDVTEISSRCPDPPEAAKKDNSCGEDSWQYRVTIEHWRELKRLRREAGLPATIREALSAGMAEKEWLDQLEKAGLLYMASAN